MGGGKTENTSSLRGVVFVVEEEYRRALGLRCEGEKSTIGTRCHQKLTT